MLELQLNVYHFHSLVLIGRLSLSFGDDVVYIQQSDATVHRLHSWKNDQMAQTRLCYFQACCAIFSQRTRKGRVQIIKMEI